MLAGSFWSGCCLFEIVGISCCSLFGIDASGCGCMPSSALASDLMKELELYLLARWVALLLLASKFLVINCWSTMLCKSHAVSSMSFLSFIIELRSAICSSLISYLTVSSLPWFIFIYDPSLPSMNLTWSLSTALLFYLLSLAPCKWPLFERIGIEGSSDYSSFFGVCMFIYCCFDFFSPFSLSSSPLRRTFLKFNVVVEFSGSPLRSNVSFAAVGQSSRMAIS